MDILKLVSVKIAAEELGVAEVTLRKWIGQRKLAIVRIGNKDLEMPTGEAEMVGGGGPLPFAPTGIGGTGGVDGALLPAARACVWKVLPGAARGV